MKKKILALVLLVALLINALPVYAEPVPTFRVDTVTAEAGDTVEVTIWIDNNPGVGNIGMEVSFDSALTLTKATINKDIEGMGSAKPLKNPLFVNWMWTDFDMDRGVYNLFGDAYFVKLTFDVADDAAAGTYPISITYEAEDVYFNEDNGDYTDVTFAVVNGGVVIEPDAIAVSGVSLDKDTLSLTEGESALLTAVVSPVDAADKTVTFTSSDSAVATVDANGKVTAVKMGSATITVTTADGNFTDSCAVTVDCAHSSKTTTAEKASDCKTQGWDTYKTCDGCGQLFNAADEKIGGIPFRPLSGTHTGGTATCVKLAVCDTCGAEYGTFGEHSYTAQTKSEEALIKAGTCSDEAVYYYSCGVCDKVEGDKTHTFLGEKDSATHTGGTTLVNKSEPNHPEQISGYTGDEVCNGCGEVLVWGDEIFAGYHIAGGPLYYDDTFHWYVCILDGCTAMQEITFHTPDHEGGATEEYAVKCTECGYIIEEQLAHTHVFNKEVATDAYKVSEATCQKKAVYYKSCACGAAGTATFEHGEKLSHKWVDADCDTPKTCSACGETEGEALGHKWVDADCDTPKTCSVCGETEGEALGHKWVDADCDTPKTCSVCGETEGEALGHKWVDADCDTPKTCSVCNETEGEALGHKWVDADCTTPKTCSVCNETEGEALGHKWVDADCDTPKTCSVCGETEGKALGHKPDRAEPTETDPVKCTVCGETLKPALGHTHKGEKVTGKEPTCTEAGHKTYYVCKCGKWFADSTSNVEIADKNSVVIEKLGHKWVDADCDTPKTCSVCNETEGEALGHKWVDADCTTPKTCSVCNETEGEALGHKWVDADCDTPKTCSVCNETEGKTLGHKWVDADCDTPKTCSVCNKTEGEALGHKWVDADCDTPKTCSVCNETEGEALGHKWVDADCDTPKTCSVCNETEGEALGHKPDRAEPTETDPVKCTVCGETLKTALGHTHKGEKVTGKEPTCTEAGHKTYYVCKCGKWFADSTSNVEIADKNSVVIEKLGHKWVDADCDTPKTCSVCNETEGEALGHKWVDADCDTPKTCSVCNETEGKALGHKWVDADCDTPKTCSVCNETEGKALGHKWVDADCDTPKTCSVCNETEGEALGHKWVDADCDTPKTCSVCNETEGEALGHKWVDADCDTPKTCSVCNETEGEALGHKWVDADCDTPKTCSVCGETEGEALGHKPDRAEPTETDPVKCTVCGDTLKPTLGHTHMTEKVDGKEPTCTEPGQKTYYTCNCGKWFADSTANVEIADKDSVIIRKLGHNWSEATCENPKTCTVCGETEGEKLEHKWIDATCTEPKTCQLCGLTEGEALGHGETEQKSNDKGHWDVCKDCGEMVSQSSQSHVDADGDEKCDECDHVMVKPGTPQTGDSTIHMLVLAMLLSLMGGSVLVLLNKKKKV